MPSFSANNKFPDEQVGSLSIPVYGYVTQSEEEAFQDIYAEYSNDVNSLQSLTDALVAINQESAEDNQTASELLESGKLAEVASKDLQQVKNPAKAAKIAELEAKINELLPKVKTNKFINKMVGFFLRSRIDSEWTDELVFEQIPSFYTNKIYELLTKERNSSFLQELILENQEIQDTSPTETAEPTG